MEEKIGYITFTKEEGPRLRGKCECGKEVTRLKEYVRNKNKTKGRIISCGCKSPLKTNTGPKSNNWQGVGEIAASYLRRIECGARARNIECNITLEDIWNKFLEQNRLCALSRLELSPPTSPRNLNMGNASLDRIDSNKGYTTDNIQWVHKDIQKMKNAYSQEYFIQTCKEIANETKKKVN